MKRILIAIPFLAGALSFSSCETGPNAQRGTAAGAVVGGIAGGVIGHQSGRTAEGALLGAGVGAAAGNVIGGNQDRAAGYYGGRRYYVDQWGRRVYY